jgi:hypothetical protein
LTVTYSTGYVGFTTTEASKLGEIAAGATANSGDATLLARANHTGSQAISTITNLQTALDAKLAAAAFTWGNLADIPSTFVPSAHAHAIADVTGLTTALSEKLDDSQATAAGLSILGAANAADQRTALELGTAATAATGDFVAAAHVGAGATAHANATTGVAGFMSGADKTKLDAVEAGATANSSDASLRSIPLNVQNATYTYVLADAGKAVLKNNTTAYSHTIPPEASVAFPDGSATTALNDGTAGDLTIVAGAGVTLIKGTTTASVVLAPGESVLLHKVGTNRWRAY